MRELAAAEVNPWTREILLNPQRDKAVIAISTQPRTKITWIAPEELASELGDLAEVVCLETGDATWELSSALPPRLDVYGGAVRIWWPGLCADSDPYDHKLYFIQSPAQARSVFRELVAQVSKAEAKSEEIAAETISVTIESVSGTKVMLAGKGHRGELRDADVPLPDLARCLSTGMTFQARPIRSIVGGHWEFSVIGLMEPPWDIVARSLEIGDVVMARVQSTREFGAFVEVFPTVTGLVHVSELDWERGGSVSDFAAPGQIVAVKIMAFNREGRRLELSMKRAFGTDPAPLPSLVPGGIPFTWSSDQAARVPRVSVEDLEKRVAGLTDEIDAMVADRAQLAESNKELRELTLDQKKQLRSSQDRFVAREQKLASELDPLASARGFLLGVRLAYARLFDEGAREENALRKMRVGESFLESLRNLDGIDPQKVLEVCAQVAADAARELRSREVHQLRDGSRGAPTRVRAKDQAQAWRCSLQVKTPSARRLHWWSIPGEHGATVEFATVCLHDQFSIPE